MGCDKLHKKKDKIRRGKKERKELDRRDRTY